MDNLFGNNVLEVPHFSYTKHPDLLFLGVLFFLGLF